MYGPYFVKREMRGSMPGRWKE